MKKVNSPWKDLVSKTKCTYNVRKTFEFWRLSIRTPINVGFVVHYVSKLKEESRLYDYFGQKSNYN